MENDNGQGMTFKPNDTFEVSDSRIDARCRGSVVEASPSISRISGEFSYSGRDNTNGVDYLATGSCEKHTGQKF